MRTILLGLMIAALASLALDAHPGHDEVKLLIGTVLRSGNGVVQMETFDPAAMQSKRVAITVDEKTKWLVGKKRGDPQELAIGERVELLVRMDDLPDGTTTLRAVQIKRKEPRKGA